MKVTTIEETWDVSTIKVDELIESLLTFEMAINDKSEKINKSVEFKDDPSNIKVSGKNPKKINLHIQVLLGFSFKT